MLRCTMVQNTQAESEMEADIERELAGANGQPAGLAEQKSEGAERPDILAIGRQSLKEFQTLLAENREKVSVDFVHDLRVSTRRLGEVVGIVEALMDAPA